MRAIDTNVAARFLLNDHADQSPIAATTIAGGVFIPHTVLLELAWLLGSRYSQPREVVAAALRDLIDLPSVVVDSPALVRWAILRFDKGGDFADMLHVVASSDSDSFASFETRLARRAGPDAPIPIETLN